MNLIDTDEMKDGTFEVGNVKMTFHKNSQAKSEELSHIYTGDEFYMFLKYSGTTEYVVMPKNCSAISGNNVDLSNLWYSKKKIELWTYKSCLSAESRNQAVMEEFSFDKDTRITKAKMYGFHFTENQDISIICDVTVCATFSGGCNEPNGTGCPTLRKKRNAGLKFTHDLEQHSHFIKKRMSKRSVQKETPLL